MLAADCTFAILCDVKVNPYSHAGNGTPTVELLENKLRPFLADTTSSVPVPSNEVDERQFPPSTSLAYIHWDKARMLLTEKEPEKETEKKAEKEAENVIGRNETRSWNLWRRKFFTMGGTG